MSLTNSALRELSFVADTEKLLDEWLRQWFDGESHVLGANEAVVWPAVQILCEGMESRQPLSGAEIALSPFENERWHVCRDWESDGVLWTTMTGILEFDVRATGNETGRSRALARQVGDLLFALLNHAQARLPLAEKGVKHLQPLPATPWRTADHARKVRCHAVLTFPSVATAVP